MRPNRRVFSLCIFWLLITAGGPINEGVEVGLDAGGGEYEHGLGCGARNRKRFAATHAFVKARPEASNLTVSAEASALTSRMIAIETDHPGSSEIEQVNLIGEERVSTAARIGGQWKYLGIEFGVGVWGDRSDYWVLPTATIRLHPLRKHTFEFTALEPPTHVHPALITLNYFYTGEKYRTGFGFRPGQEMDLWSEVGYRFEEKHSIGLELHYFANGYFGPMGAAFLQYRWLSNSAASPSVGESSKINPEK